MFSKILHEVNFFVGSLDGLSVAAGPYFNCTRSIILSFCAALATYVMVLWQSIQ